MFSSLGNDFKGDLKFNFNVGSFGRPLFVSSEKSLKEPFSKKIAHLKIKPHSAENILKVDPPKEILRRISGNAGKPSAVIFGPFLGVGEDCIGFGNLLELLFGFRGFVAVGMVFEGQISKSLLDGFLVGIVANPKDLVVVSFRVRDFLPLLVYLGYPC